jgi:uncharacterized protein (DUF1684 family)
MPGGRLLALAVTASAAVACAAAPATQKEGVEVNDHRAEVERWKAQRSERLRRDDGWLTLVGLYWLAPGENRFGTDRANELLFPEGTAPGHLGAFDLKDGVVRVRVASGATVTHEGKPVREMELQSDAAGSPTILQHGSLKFHAIKRGDRFGIRLKDSQAKALREFRGMEYFPFDEGWRVTARFEPYSPAREITVPNVTGEPTRETVPGALVFEKNGKSYRLDPVAEEGSEELFIIFGDQTNGHETYGAGRFVYAPQPDSAGRVVLDFNRSYNPPCVFTPYATCPLPPPQNKLALRIEAGEKSYEGH